MIKRGLINIFQIFTFYSKIDTFQRITNQITLLFLERSFDKWDSPLLWFLCDHCAIAFLLPFFKLVIKSEFKKMLVYEIFLKDLTSTCEIFHPPFLFIIKPSTKKVKLSHFILKHIWLKRMSLKIVRELLSVL